MITTIVPKKVGEKYLRFSRSDRMEHWALIISFTMLGVTGLPQRYAIDYAIARDAIDLLGGIESVRVMHRFFAIILMATSIYHGGALSYKLFVQRVRLSMIPSLKDMRDALQVFLYNLGLSKAHPRMPRFNFGEKAEYLAVVWGTILMVITGFMLWNPIATTKFLPGTFVPAARIAHSAEAVLAIAAIILWHMYNVHIKRFNRSIFTGKLDEEAMHEEHLDEVEEIEQGLQYQPPMNAGVGRRETIFRIYAAVVSVLLITGLYFFVTFEETAIETTERQALDEIGDLDLTAADSANGAQLWVDLDCHVCHGEAGEGVYPVPPLDSTDVSPHDFAVATRRGPADMPGYTTDQLSDEGLADLYIWLHQDSQEQE